MREELGARNPEPEAGTQHPAPEPGTQHPAPDRDSPPVLVLCLGNDLRQDDGVGWAIADVLEQDPPPRAVVRRSAMSGFYLLDELLGVQRIVVVDAIQTGRRVPGSVIEFTMEALDAPAGPSPHAVGLPTVLALGRRAGLALPCRVDVVAVEVQDMSRVSEEISDTVRRAIPGAVAAVRRRVEAA